jgi:hypothetical protein
MSSIRYFRPSAGDDVSVHFTFRPRTQYTEAEVHLRWYHSPYGGEHTLWTGHLPLGAPDLHGLDPVQCALLLGDLFESALRAHSGVYHAWPGPGPGRQAEGPGAPGGATGAVVDLPLPGLEFDA